MGTKLSRIVVIGFMVAVVFNLSTSKALAAPVGSDFSADTMTRDIVHTGDQGQRTAQLVAQVREAYAATLRENEFEFKDFQKRIVEMRNTQIRLRKAPRQGGFAFLRFSRLSKPAFDTKEWAYADEISDEEYVGVRALPAQLYDEINTAIEAAYSDGFDTFPIDLATGIKAWGQKRIGVFPRKEASEKVECLKIAKKAPYPQDSAERFKEKVAAIEALLYEAQVFHRARTQGDPDKNLEKSIEDEYELFLQDRENIDLTKLASKKRDEAVKAQLKPLRETWDAYIEKHDTLVAELQDIIEEHRKALVAHGKLRSRERLKATLAALSAANAGITAAHRVAALPGGLAETARKLILKAFSEGLMDSTKACLSFERQPEGEAAKTGYTARLYTVKRNGEEIAHNVTRKSRRIRPDGSMELTVQGQEEPLKVDAPAGSSPKEWTEYFRGE